MDTVAHMKPSELAENNGARHKTAYTWFHAGILPVPAVQLPTSPILAQEPRIATESRGGAAGRYARVSSSDPKDDLRPPAGATGGLCRWSRVGGHPDRHRMPGTE